MPAARTTVGVTGEGRTAIAAVAGMRGGAAVTMAHLGTQEITITIAAAGIAAAIAGPLGAATAIPTPGGSHPLAIIQ